MQKDVVYIDVEDDITAIIGKLKGAKHKIVALVPPKRVGVLQSAVNLRLLARAAEQHDKRLVIITGNHALSGLAASAAIPVAKNLQSKPEIAEIAALDVDDGEDVIDGAALPVGEHAKQAESEEDTAVRDTVAPAAGVAAVASRTAKAAKKGMKVPNFDSFRKRLFIGGIAGVLLIAFLVWANVFAPHAKVILLARTTDASVSQQVQLSSSADSSAANTILHVEQKQVTKDVSVDFDATGKKNVGEKASGSIIMTTCAGLSTPTAVPSGTTVSAGSQNFTTTSTGNFAYDSIGNGCINYKTGAVSITANSRGEGGNVSGASFTVAEFGSVSASGTTSGGTDKTVAVVSQDDVDKAKKAAEAEVDKTALAKELAGQFGDSYIVMTDTLDLKLDSLKAEPAVGSELESGKAKYGGTATATLYAVSKDELGKYLDAVLEQQMDNKDQQRVYENGGDKAVFSNVVHDDKKLTINLSADGKIGPKIDEETIKKLAAGKNYGEIQAALSSTNGISEVDTKFSPFWVHKAPTDTKKISIEFKVDE